jgi:FAD/FMN-containing dehydrogenase
VSKANTKKLKGFGGLGIVLQPFPRAFGKASDERGGNAMGLSGKENDRFVLEIAGVYNSKDDDEQMQAWGREFTDQLTSRLKTVVENAKRTGSSVGEYNPYFMNDAGPDQDVMGSYRDAKKFTTLQKELDPKGLFSKRAGGFKLKT